MFYFQPFIDNIFKVHIIMQPNYKRRQIFLVLSLPPYSKSNLIKI